MNDKSFVKGRIDFAEIPVITHNDNIKSAHTFTEDQQQRFIADNDAVRALAEENSDKLQDAIFRPRRKIWHWLAGAGFFIFIVTIAGERLGAACQALINHDWRTLGITAAGTLIIVAVIGSLTIELCRLRRLRQRAEERDTSRELLNSQGAGHGQLFCEELIRKSKLDESHPALQRWYAAINATQNDREIVILYARLIQPVIDKQARREISRSSAEAALMIAISPLATVDMVFIAWRNLRLINRLAALYGLELGYMSRIRLFRMVLVNIAFAGAGELMRESGLEWMSQSLAARLSVRAAQGIGVGLLTARLGIKTMELCRPLPWLDDDKPQLADFRRELITELKQVFRQSS